jgi:hypothetical protein
MSAPGVFEVLLHVPLMVVIVGGVLALRKAQPDPNRGPAPSAQVLHALIEEDRRKLQMPYVGLDRRKAGAADAAAWRHAA